MQHHHSARTPAYIDVVTQPFREPVTRVLAVRHPHLVVKATGWRWVGSRRDNWTEVQVLIDGVQRHTRSVDDATSPMFSSLLSIYVGDDAERLWGEVKAALQ